MPHPLPCSWSSSVEWRPSHIMYLVLNKLARKKSANAWSFVTMATCSLLQRTSLPHPTTSKCAGIGSTAGWAPASIVGLQKALISCRKASKGSSNSITMPFILFSRMFRRESLLLWEHTVVQYCQAANILFYRSIR